MRRRTRLLLLAAAAGLIVPTAVNSTAASAVDQDLMLSATSGAAGVQVTASSASCDVTDSEEGFGYLSVRLISGTGTDAVLAGVAIGIDDQAATFVIPDWVDPTADSVVEATCNSLDFSTEEPTPTVFTYDPVAFDIEGSGGSPVQARSYNRTSLLAGQAFQVDGSGCFLAGAESAFVSVSEGSDLTFRTEGNYVAGGFDEASGSTFSVPTALSNGSIDLSVSQVNDQPPTVDEINESPTDIPAGTYSSISYCANADGVNLLFEPQLIEVTGDAPFGDVDLTVPAQTRTATLAGGSCTSGDVTFEMNAIDIDDEFGGSSSGPLTEADRALSPVAVSALRGPLEPGTVAHDNDAWARNVTGTRALGGSEWVEGTLTPEPDGAWTFSTDVAFDNGVVEGYSWCGDPLTDGFLYDPQVAAVSVTPVVPTVPPTVPETVPTPRPADAVSGTPTYAG